MAIDRYGEAIGLWHIDINEADFDLKLQMGDGRKLRRILMDDNNRKDKAGLFEKFADFMFEIIKRQYPEDEDERVKSFIEFNILQLFEEAQITFRFSTREDIEKAKVETNKEIKKLIEND